MPYTDPNNPSMDTWYDDPSTATGPYGTGGGTPQQAATRDQIIAWYQQYLGRTPSDAEIQSHSGNPAGAAGVQDAIQNGQEGKAYASRPEPTTNQTTPTNPTNPTNPTTPQAGGCEPPCPGR